MIILGQEGRAGGRKRVRQRWGSGHQVKATLVLKVSATLDNANAKRMTAGGRSDGDSNRESTETHLQSFTPLTAPSYIHT